MPSPRHPDRPKRSRDPFKAAYEVFQEAIGERPRTVPVKKARKPATHPPAKKARKVR